jgi:hypothetical protein
MEWRGAPPPLNGWMHNSLPSVPFFQPANAINPYTSGYGHFLPVQMLPGLSQINLLNHLHSSGSMMSNDSLQSQNRSQHANQNLFTTAIHPNISGLTGRQVLRAPQTFSEISGFGSAAIPVDIIQKAQKAQKSSPERSRGGNGKFTARVEYPLSVKLGAVQWRKQYLEGLIPNPDGRIGLPKSRQRFLVQAAKTSLEYRVREVV